nr:retrovirus-related Pol polyprotein from transposon TNT 1-94 [Tanacetum cinerariifolium]
TKDETSSILKKFITEIENLKDLKVKIIKCDNGGEFKNKELNDFCSQKGIKRELSNARTPRQNGVAERRNRSLIEAARTMLADAKLPVTFWAEAVNTACYVQNRVLVSKAYNKTSYELFNGRTPTIRFFKPFGCHVMILNTLDNLGKFEAKWDEGYFLRYSMSIKAFRIFNKRTKRVKENVQIENKAIEKGSGPNWLFDINSLTKSMNYVPVVDAGTHSTNFSGTRNTDVPESSGNSNPTATLTNPPDDQLETLTVETPIPTASSLVPTVCFTDSQEPKKIYDALQDPSWVEAMQEELLQFKIQKEEGIDYDEVFAPIARIEAIRLFLAYASFMGFTVYQMDVKNAFLYGTVDEEVYMMQPPRFQDPEGTIDHTLFIRRQRGDFILVQVYMDDIIFGSSNP